MHLKRLALSRPAVWLAFWLALTLLILLSQAIPHGGGYFTAISNSATRPELLTVSAHTEAQKCIELIIL